MAKLGEGDPRWLVKERNDGKNVGDWHWTEGDLTPWAKETLTKRLGELTLVDNDTVCAKVTKASNFDGDVTISKRKGKTIYFYDLSITLNWTGELKDGSLSECEGKIEVSDIEQDGDAKDFDFRLSITGAETAAHRKIKEVVKEAGIEAIGKVVKDFNEQLRARAGLADAKEYKPKPIEAVAADAELAKKTVKKSEKVEVITTKNGGKLSTSKVNFNKSFRCRPSDLIECLTNKARVCAFTQDGSATVASKEDEQFRLYDGTISGKLLEKKEDKLIMDWRLKQWPNDHFAKITMTFEFADGKTKAKCVATGVPSTDSSNLSQAFDHFYWQRIGGVFGYRV